MPYSRVRLEINLGRLAGNFAEIRRRVKPCRTMAVLKANAYGLGVGKIAETLKNAGADMFGVAEINEAIELAPLGMDVQILGTLLPDELEPAVEYGVICPIGSPAEAEAVSREAGRQGRTARCAVAVDSGMGRVGFLAGSAAGEIARAMKFPGLDFVGIYSHCSCAFDPGDDYTHWQIERFRKLLYELENAGLNFPMVHIAASDALNNFDETVRAPFNLARCGLNMYGYYDNAVRHSMRLEPVVELKTVLAAVRTLPEGSSIGYGRMHRLLKPTRVGTIAAGYADGMPLALSNRGYVLCNGRLCPVLGRISMDYTTISLDDAPDAKPGDEVVCFGGQGDRSIPLDYWAQLKGTHAYELLCAVGGRVKREYIK